MRRFAAGRDLKIGEAIDKKGDDIAGRNSLKKRG